MLQQQQATGEWALSPIYDGETNSPLVWTSAPPKGHKVLKLDVLVWWLSKLPTLRLLPQRGALAQAIDRSCLLLSGFLATCQSLAFDESERLDALTSQAFSITDQLADWYILFQNETQHGQMRVDWKKALEPKPSLGLRSDQVWQEYAKTVKRRRKAEATCLEAFGLDPGPGPKIKQPKAPPQPPPTSANPGGMSSSKKRKRRKKKTPFQGDKQKEGARTDPADKEKKWR